ncbi:MAG: hypothetical protein WAK17_07070 [Candidatus Nitrosopolaris sp.]
MGQNLKIEGKIVSFHLNQLEGVGLVEAKYTSKEVDKVYAIKSYKITNQGKRIYNHIISLK